MKLFFKFIAATTIFCTFFMPSFSLADQDNLLAIAQRLQNSYEKAGNLVADFTQTTSMKFSERARQGSGSLIFLRPGMLRWDYKLPDHQVIISDGESIFMYFEKSNQMIISNAKDYLQSDVTYSFFTGTGNILKDFTVTKPDFENIETNTHLIKLIPESTHPHVSYIHAWVTSENYLLEHLQIVDHFDTVTDLYFNNILIDTETYTGIKISEQMFSFTPPENTEIIRQY